MTQPLLPKELFERIKSGESVQIIDVRSPGEFDACHIPGARNVPLPTIVDRIPDVDPNIPLVVVCQGGVRSAAACAKIAASHSQIYDLVGGTSAWCQNGLATDDRPKAVWGLDRQTHLVAGLLILLGLVLGLAVGPGWLALSALPGCGLILHATTNICPMSILLAHAPWNGAPNPS